MAAEFPVDVVARGIRTATSVVDVAPAAAPTAGQVLTATDGTHATWEDSAGGGGGAPSGAAGGVLGGTYPNPGFAVDMATQAELDAHSTDTTNQHGIADTSVLETTSGSAAKVAAHEADTTSVHGIANTAVLETASGAQAKADAAQAAAIAASQPLDSDLTAIAALSTTAYGRSLLALADAAALRDALAVQPQVRAIRSTALTIATGTATAVTLDNTGTAPAEDNNTFWSAGNPTRLTAAKAGLYLVSTLCYWTAAATGSRISWVHKNGSAAFRYLQNQLPASSTINSPDHATGQIRLAAGDYLELIVFHDRGSNLDLTTNAGLVYPAELQMCRLQA